jgi:signal transduction histidine kinase
MVAVAPLLPRFLLRGVDDPPWLHWRVETADGFVLASSPGAGSLEGEFAARDTTSRFLDGAVVRAKLDPDAAATLVSGCVPSTNLPQTLALLLLGGGLLGVAWARCGRPPRAPRGLRRDVSHELRTPLAQIRLFVETLRLHRTRGRRGARARAHHRPRVVPARAPRAERAARFACRPRRAHRGRLRRTLAAPLRETATSFRAPAATRGGT